MNEPTELEKSEADLKHEIEKWDVLGIDIGQVQIHGGVVKVSQRIDTLIELLLEKEVFTREEMDLRFNQIALRTLSEMRAALAPIVQQAKLEAIKAGQLRKH